MATGYFREAEACHRMAATGNSASAEAVQQWAFALEKLGELDAANLAYARAAQIDKARSANCAYCVGRNKLRQEDVDAARQAFRDAGDLPAARYELARLLFREGRRDEAAAAAEQLAREFPEYQQPDLLLHLIAVTAQRLPAAQSAADRQDAARAGLPNPFAADFERLRAAHDQLGLKRRWLEARRVLEEGNWSAAERAFRDALAARYDPYPADWLAEAMFLQGRQEEAVQLEEEIIQRFGPKIEYLERLGDMLDAQGKKEEARGAWLRAVRLSFGPQLRDIHGKLAESLANEGQEPAAKLHLAQAALAAGMAEFRAGQPAAAQLALREAVRLDPELATAWYYLGEAARRQSDREAARQALERCLSIQPHHGRAADALEAIHSE
jgi:tetratricopeptide (TPR) repeat protein